MAVYMIRAGIAGDVKIGLAIDPLKRMQGLQTSNTAKLHLIRVLEGGRDVEKALHARFAAWRKAGEWFTFAPEMLADDIGFPVLPIPKSKRGGRFDDTAQGRKRAFHDDIMNALGGADVIARRLGVPPWVAVDWEGVRPNYLSAVALMMRDAGYRHVTVPILLRLNGDVLAAETLEAETRAEAEEDAREARAEASRAARAAQVEAEQEAHIARAEAEWVRKNGVKAAWWELRPENCPSPANTNLPPALDTDEAGDIPSPAAAAA